MELWIRIQNKYRLLKVNNIIVSKSDVCCDDDKGRLCLGGYENEERALEVLDEIQNLLDDISDNKIVGCVYQMPNK